MLVACGVGLAQPAPLPLPNGWLGGYTLPPATCSSGNSPVWYYVPAATLYRCQGNVYVLDAVNSVCIANTDNGSAYGCNVGSPQVSGSVTIPSGTLITFIPDVWSLQAPTLTLNGGVPIPITKFGNISANNVYGIGNNAYNNNAPSTGPTVLTFNDLVPNSPVILVFDGTNWDVQGMIGNGDGTVFVSYLPYVKQSVYPKCSTLVIRFCQ